MGDVLYSKRFKADKEFMDHLRCGKLIIDLNDGFSAAVAMNYLLSMNKRGLCEHKRIDEHRGEFWIKNEVE